MQTIQKLTKQEKLSFQKAISLFLPDQITKKSAIKYYLEFISNCPNIQTEKLDYYFKSAFFIAEKSTYLINVKGQRIKGITLSVSQIIKSCPNIHQMIDTIKNFIKWVALPDYQINTEINNFIDIWEFGCAFAAKFQKTWRQLNFQQKVNQSFGYRKTFISFAWLLFIDAKDKIIKNESDYIQATHLLVSTYYFMIRYSMQYIQPTFLIQLQDKNHKKSLITQIIQKLLQMFSITDIQSYKNTAKRFDIYFQQLLQTEVIRCSNQETDFLSPTLINVNYKKLDTNYQKKIQLNQIDFRLFLNNRVTTLSPSKFSMALKHKPFKAKQPICLGQDNKKNYASHKVLNYDLCDSTTNMNPRNSPKQLKLPFSLVSSPSLSKTPLLCATPVTMGMEMYNYINSRVKMVRNSHQRTFYQEAIKYIQKIMCFRHVNLYDQSNLNNKNMLAFSFYVSLAQEFFSIEQETESYHLSLLCISIYIIRMLNNANLASFFDLKDYLEPNILDLWTVCHFVSRFDKKMPQSIKSQISQILSQIVTHEAWKNQTIIDDIAQLAANMNQDKYLSIFVKNLLKYCDQQINSIGKYLKLNYQVLEQSFNCIKFFLSSQGQIILNRHIDQLIICSIYVACKTNNLRTKFNQIKIAYEKTNKWSQYMHYEILCKVHLQEEEETIDIIRFYNLIFIMSVKPFIPYMKQPSFQEFNSVFQKKLRRQQKNLQKFQGQNQQDKVLVNKINIESQKPQKIHINSKTARQNTKISRIISQQQLNSRNETTLRVRPQVVNIKFLCDTEKGRNHYQDD